MPDHGTDSSDRPLAQDVDMEDDPNVKRKGRGFGARSEGPAVDGVKAEGFEALEDVKEGQDRAAKSVGGWVIVVTNVHDEAAEEEVMDKFADFGQVKTCHLNLDRRTGYVKGYALLEFETKEEATAAIEACSNGLTLLDERLEADFAFLKPPEGMDNAPPSRGRRGNTATRHRSRSPETRQA